jgi:hypothetical protein
LVERFGRGGGGRGGDSDERDGGENNPLKPPEHVNMIL